MRVLLNPDRAVLCPQGAGSNVTMMLFLSCNRSTGYLSAPESTTNCLLSVTTLFSNYSPAYISELLTVYTSKTHKRLKRTLFNQDYRQNKVLVLIK